MTGLVFGQDDATLRRKLGSRSATDLQARGVVVGTGSEIVPQLHQIAAAGIYRVMLQWLDLDDLDGLAALAHTVLPQLA